MRRTSVDRETVNPLQQEPDSTKHATTYDVEPRHKTKTPVSHWHLAVQKISAVREFTVRMEEKRRLARLVDGDADSDSASTSVVGAMSVDAGWTPRKLTNDGVPAVVYCAAEGMLMELQKLLEMMPMEASATVAEELDSIVIPDGADAGQNALIKAIRNNHPRCAEALLQAGASPVVCDVKYRSAWYYACFGVNIPKGQHKHMVQVLTKGTDMSSVTSEVVLCTCYTRNESVTWNVLDALKCEITSKDSKGNCEFLFHDLHILDNPQAVMTWPDGSTTNPKETAVKILTAQARIDVLVHPAMRGLLHWKLERFGKPLMVLEFGVYFAWLLAFSLVLLLLPAPEQALNAADGSTVVATSVGESGVDSLVCARFSVYQTHADYVRGTLEVLTLILQTLLVVVHCVDSEEHRSNSGRQITRELPCLTHCPCHAVDSNFSPATPDLYICCDEYASVAPVLSQAMH